MSEELVHSALRKAIGSNQLGVGSVIHSDRGGQYIGKSFRQTLLDHRFEQSMSRPDAPYDNRTGGPAFMESCRFGGPMVTPKSRTFRGRGLWLTGRCSY